MSEFEEWRAGIHVPDNKDSLLARSLQVSLEARGGSPEGCLHARRHVRYCLAHAGLLCLHAFLAGCVCGMRVVQAALHGPLGGPDLAVDHRAAPKEKASKHVSGRCQRMRL